MVAVESAIGIVTKHILSLASHEKLKDEILDFFRRNANSDIDRAKERN